MLMTPTRILIADDQPDVLNALRLLLKTNGYEIESVSTPAELLRTVEARPFDLLLMDLNYARDTTSGREGLELLNRLKELEDAPAIEALTQALGSPLGVSGAAWIPGDHQIKTVDLQIEELLH